MAFSNGLLRYAFCKDGKASALWVGCEAGTVGLARGNHKLVAISLACDESMRTEALTFLYVSFRLNIFSMHLSSLENTPNSSLLHAPP